MYRQSVYVRVIHVVQCTESVASVRCENAKLLTVSGAVKQENHDPEQTVEIWRQTLYVYQTDDCVFVELHSMCTKHTTYCRLYVFRILMLMHVTSLVRGKDSSPESGASDAC